MDISKILSLVEARKNPELNPKVSPYQRIKERYAKDGDNLYVSFTAIDKLGINPRSEYATPLGIYAYPAKYILEVVSAETENMNELPFAGNNPYVNIFNASGNIVHLGEMTQSEMMGYFEKLKKVWIKEYDKISKSDKRWKSIVDTAEKLLNDSSSGDRANFPDYPGGRFWYITYKAIKHIPGNSRSVTWNSLFRKIGIDGCRDDGIGIIHTSEPDQAVFFSKSVIKNVERIDNKWNLKSKEEGQMKSAPFSPDFTESDVIKYLSMGKMPLNKLGTLPIIKRIGFTSKIQLALHENEKNRLVQILWKNKVTPIPKILKYIIARDPHGFKKYMSNYVKVDKDIQKDLIDDFGLKVLIRAGVNIDTSFTTEQHIINLIRNYTIGAKALDQLYKMGRIDFTPEIQSEAARRIAPDNLIPVLAKHKIIPTFDVIKISLIMHPSVFKEHMKDYVIIGKDMKVRLLTAKTRPGVNMVNNLKSAGIEVDEDLINYATKQKDK